MSTGLIVFLFAIVIALIAVAGVLAVYVSRHFPTDKYDERQKIARGNAYRFSHWTGMVYYFGLLVYFIFHTGEQEWILEPFVLIMIGILLQLQSFHIYCVMTHSSLPLGEKPLPTIVGYAVLGILYLVQYFGQYIPEDTPWLTGADSYNLFRLLISLDFFSLAIMHIISLLWREKE